MSYNKYGNHSKTVDGIKFDSIKEANRYKELKMLERCGAINRLILQPVFELQPSFKKNGKTYRSIKYIADFAYIINGKVVIEDVKGVKTDVYKLKKKLFEYKFDYEITEV